MHFLWRVAADLRDAGGEVGHHVGIAVERGVHPVDVLGVVGKVHADEGGQRMPGDDTVQRVEQVHARRIFLGVTKPPRAMIL